MFVHSDVWDSCVCPGTKYLNYTKRESNFIYYQRGCKSIYRSLSYIPLDPWKIMNSIATCRRFRCVWSIAVGGWGGTGTTDRYNSLTATAGGRLESVGVPGSGYCGGAEHFKLLLWAGGSWKFILIHVSSGSCCHWVKTVTGSCWAGRDTGGLAALRPGWIP